MIRRLLPALLAVLVLTSSPVRSQITATAPATSADQPEQLRELLPLAEQGHPIAQFNLGVMHDFGQGVPKDHLQAVKWYRLAAAQGHGAAQFNLAGLYYEGLGVPRDLVRAEMWFTLSAAAGVPGAAKNRSGVARMLTAGELAQAQALARACRQQAFKDCD